MSEQDNKELLCPYRKKLKADLTSVNSDLKVDAVRIWDEVFGPCVKEQCAMWREKQVMRYSRVQEVWKPTGAKEFYCGLAGKPHEN